MIGYSGGGGATYNPPVGTVLQEVVADGDGSGNFSTTLPAASGLVVTPWSITITPLFADSAIDVDVRALMTASYGSGAANTERYAAYWLSRGNSAAVGSVHNGTLAGGRTQKQNGRILVTGSTAASSSRCDVEATIRDKPGVTTPVTYTLVAAAAVTGGGATALGVFNLAAVHVPQLVAREIKQ